MNWSNLHEVTAQNEKPAPGWLFQEICRDAKQYPHDIPDTAEYLMRCVACDSQTVCMKACLALRHLADDVPEFRAYMQRCPEALGILREISEPPQLAITQSIERPETKVGREAAGRALRSCLADCSKQDVAKEHVKQRIQGFGNFAPPPEDDAPPAGLVDKVAGFVGDAVGDTIDDFRDKGAVGAVRDGLADAADLILDGVGAVWGFLGGRKNSSAPVEDRICRPADHMSGTSMHPEGLAAQMQGTPGIYPGAAYVPHGVGMPMGFTPVPVPAAASSSAAGSFQGAFGSGVVGAGHAFHPSVLNPDGQYSSYDVGSAVVAARNQACAGSMPLPEQPPSASAPAEPAAPPVDLLSFEDEASPRRDGTSDLLSFDAEAGFAAACSSSAGNQSVVMDLKSKGNDLVRQKKHSEALQVYEAALSTLEGQNTEEVGKLRAVLFANIALCYLQVKLHRRAIDAATCSIQSDRGHAKGYYRRCLAYKALEMYSEAAKDLEALQLCRHDMTKAEMQRLRATISAGNTG